MTGMHIGQRKSIKMPKQSQKRLHCRSGFSHVVRRGNEDPNSVKADRSTVNDRHQIVLNALVRRFVLIINAARRTLTSKIHSNGA